MWGVLGHTVVDDYRIDNTPVMMGLRTMPNMQAHKLAEMGSGT